MSARFLPDATELPAEILSDRQWVGWRYVIKPDTQEPTKVPFQITDEEAKSNDPATWTSFDGVYAAALNGDPGFDGIGYVFRKGSGLAGVDLDNCLTEEGSVRDWAMPILARFAGSYQEVSPSGRGIKILCRGELARGRKIEFLVDGVKCGVEAYSWGRYFTITGRRWRNAPREITPHQADIETALAVASQLAAPSPAAQAAAAKDGLLVQGERHEALKRTGVRLRAAGLDGAEIEAALLAFNARRCSPPKSEHEVRELARWVGEHRFDGDIDPATLPKLVGESGENIYAEQVVDVQPLVTGLIYPGCTIFGGRPKGGKSWLMLQAALGFAEGSAIAGRLYVKDPGQVLYLALEESKVRTNRRMHKLTPQSDFLRDITFMYRKEVLPAAEGGILQIGEYLKAHRATRLVVIDTLLAFQRVERKKSGDLLLSDYNMIQPMQEMAALYDVAIVIVDHTRKLGGDAIDLLAGTSGKTAAPDCVITLQKQGDGTSLLNVIPRDDEQQVYQMRLYGDGDPDHPFGWWIVATGDDATNSVEAQEVVDLLRGGSFAPKEIARQLGKKEATVRKRLQRLTEQGKIRKDEDGKYHASSW